MMIEARQMVPITRLQKEISQTIRHLSDSDKAVYILKNNNIEAVLISYQEYEHLKEIEEIFEQFEIKTMIDSRSQKYDQQKNIPYKKLRKRIADRK